MDKCVILVDNSNVFIEGQKHSARLKGVPGSSPTGKDPCDPSWRISFGDLLSSKSGGRKILAAILVGSRPSQNDSVWVSAKNVGFTVIVHDRNSQNEEKAVDTELVAQGTEIICSVTEPMVLIIASGDEDFLPLVNVAHRKKWGVEMWAFSSAFNHSGGMATSVERVRTLDTIFHKIGRYDFNWPVPTTPESSMSGIISSRGPG